MPQGDKSSYTDQQKGQADHLETGCEGKGLSMKAAARTAGARLQSFHRRKKPSMKRSLLALVFAGLVAGPLTSAEAAVETYDIDPAHTWVGFTVSHFFTKVPGYFGKLKGTIVVDRDQLENSTTEALIEVASITTNTRMRDDDLRSANQGVIGNSVDVVIHVEADLRKAAPATP